jgi:TRAP transporter TAXI family solute receptor
LGFPKKAQIKSKEEAEMKKNLRKKSLLWISVMLLIAGFFVSSEVRAAEMTSITVTGAGKGANAFRAFAGLAEAVNQNSKWLRATNRESGGLVEGTRLCARDRVQVAGSSGPLVDFWQRKENPFERDTGPRDTLRGIGPFGEAPLQIVVLKDSNIKTFMDLKDKRVNLGPKGSNSNWMITFALKAAGIFDTVRKDTLNWNDAATYLVDHKLDAFGIPNSLGASAAILRAAYSAPIRVLSLPDVVLQKFLSYSGGYYKDTVDCGTVYKGMENQSFTTVSYMALVISNKDVSDKIVYEVTHWTYDPKNHDLLVNIATGWKIGLALTKTDKFITAMKKAGMKLHPGAAKYWKERGYKVD